MIGRPNLGKHLGFGRRLPDESGGVLTATLVGKPDIDARDDLARLVFDTACDCGAIHDRRSTNANPLLSDAFRRRANCHRR